MAKSIGSSGAGKPSKPRPNFPLFPHQNGKWCKKIRGRFVYFGRWAADPEGKDAENLWIKQREALLAGRVPREAKGDEVTLKAAVNRFLTSKQRAVNAKELSVRTFSEYFATCKRLLEAFGSDRVLDDIQTEDFARYRERIAKTRGPVAVGNEITRAKMLFKFCFDEGLLEHPVRYGQSFSKPPRKAYEDAKHDRGPKMFTAAEIRLMLDAVSGKRVEIEDTTRRARPLVDNPTLRAIVLMGINCGYGQTDIALVPKTAIDLEGGWATFRRPKTRAYRRAKLWPETVEALKAADKVRPEPADAGDSHLFFLTSRGKPWVRDSVEDIETAGVKTGEAWKTRTDSLGTVFGKLLKALSIDGRRGYYGLRHSHQTAAEECLDMPAVKLSMGHKDSSMSGNYRGEISDARLQAVADAVHRWLFGT